MSVLRMSLYLLFVACLAGMPMKVNAQPTDNEIGDMATFLVLFPQLRTLPAPNWVQPGMRVSYQLAGAANAGGAGGGIMQYDITATDALQVTSQGNAYGDGGSGLVPLYSVVGLGLPGVGPFWINPSVLANAEELSGDSLTVSRYEKNVGAKNLTVVRFQTATQNGQTVFEIDSETGVLVFHSISSGTGAAQVTLLNTRQLDLPWQPDRAPNWARVDARLEYSGVRSTTIPYSGTMNQNVSLTSTIRRAGARWSVLETQSQIQTGASEQGAASTGVGQLVGSYWLPRNALTANLPTEAVMIDQDPTTNASLYLVKQNDNTILLQQVMTATRLTWVYNPVLGVMERFVSEVQTPTSQEVTDMVRSGGSDLSVLNQQTELPDDPTPGSNNSNNSNSSNNSVSNNATGPQQPGGPGINIPPQNSNNTNNPNNPGLDFEPPSQENDTPDMEQDSDIIVLADNDDSACSITSPRHTQSRPSPGLLAIIGLLVFVHRPRRRRGIS